MRHGNDNCDLTMQTVVTCWHTSYGSTKPTIHKYAEVVIWWLVR